MGKGKAKEVKSLCLTLAGYSLVLLKSQKEKQVIFMGGNNLEE